jgi:K+-transporting ATPase c subunit
VSLIQPPYGAAGQAFFHDKADGSLIVDKSGVVRGSMLLAQSFASDKYFQPRPSAAGTGYDSTNSSGTNYGPTSAKLANGSHAKDAQGKDVNDPNNFDGIKDLVAAYRASNGLKASDPVPADAVTRSASGPRSANQRRQCAPPVRPGRQGAPRIDRIRAGPDYPLHPGPGTSESSANRA